MKASCKDDIVHTYMATIEYFSYLFGKNKVTKASYILNNVNTYIVALRFRRHAVKLIKSKLKW